MSAPVELVSHAPEWRQRFGGVGRRLRLAFGDGALRIDHVGATAVEGLPARDVVDVQLSVRSLTPEIAYREPLSALGYAMIAGHEDQTQRFFREANTPSRVHLHVRSAGSFGEQATLLLRDYLRAQKKARAAYAKRKAALADAEESAASYASAHADLLWATLGDAFRWAQATGWAPGISDA